MQPRDVCLGIWNHIVHARHTVGRLWIGAMKGQAHAAQPVQCLGGVTEKPSAQFPIVPRLDIRRGKFPGILNVGIQRVLKLGGPLHGGAIGGEGTDGDTGGAAKLRLFLQ